MCSIEEYWARIGRIPLYPDRETDDGTAIASRNFDNSLIVRVQKAETFESDDDREAAVQFYEMFYRPPTAN